MACQGMALASLSQATRAVDELLRRAYLGQVVPDAIPDPMRTPLGSAGYTSEQLQGLIDRVDGVNSYVTG
jgi:hypothetical protein